MFENLKNYILDDEYIVSLMNNQVHIYNYISIDSLNDKYIDVLLNCKTIRINGNDLYIKKMDKKEILISGNIIDIKLR